MPSFPAVLRRAWRASDPATRCERRCDALDRPTVHQRLRTVRGDYWICAQTGQMTADVFPPHDAALYDQWWSEHAPDEQQLLPAVQERRAWLERFECYRQTGRLLEIGAGQGVLLKAAMKRSWRAEGSEISPVAAEWVRRWAGAPVLVGAAEDADLARDSYDLILCDNVFEHLDQPLTVLRKLAAALRPGGAIYLQTLCAQSLSLWVQPRAWCYYGQGHTHLPTLVSLRHYTAACGLRPVRWRTHGFRSGPEPHRAPSPAWRRRGDKVVAALAGRLNLGHRVEAVLERPAPP